MDSKYCYPGSDVLINKLNIRDPKKLHETERVITSRRTIELLKAGIKEPFDFDCLKKIHKVLFSELYPFAGKVRDVDIAKADLFCRAIFVENQADFIFRKLKKDNYLNGLDKDQFISKLADFMADVNALHPFREGNGRTQRIFFQALAERAGYEIDFASMDKNVQIDADIAGMRGNTSPLIILLSEHCIDLYKEIGKRIEAGLAKPEEVARFKELQEQRFNRSIYVAKEKSKAISLSSPDLTR